MPTFNKRWLPLWVILGLAGLAISLWLGHRRAACPAAPLPKPSPILSALAEMPDWKELEAFQNTITRADFERLLTTVFTTGTGWKAYLEIDDREARIRTGDPHTSEIFHLNFATPGHAVAPPRPWRPAAELAPAPSTKPLSGMRIAIDPGHIGGAWAKIEERWFVTGEGKPIREGNLTLTVAQLLKPRLAALGATVSLIRAHNAPVTPWRPESLLAVAGDSSASGTSPAARQRLAARLFYRTAEIRARAQLVNHSLKPDLVLCLHFNADSWGDPDHPTLVNRHHLHLLLNGAYSDEEVALADQRFEMLKKLLRRTHEEESLVGASVADTFAARSGLPAFSYSAAAGNALPVNGHPYLWARNLLANRLYDCPVIFMEPYVMNSNLDYPRLAAGDYDGLRKINGQARPSIFREYADALSQALARHYAQHRPSAR